MMGVLDYIRAEAARTPSGTPLPVLASNTLRSIPRDEMSTIVHELMCLAIRSYNGTGGQREGLTLNSPAPRLASISANGQPETKPGRSKWEVCQSAWRKALNQSHVVNGATYRLGDMTADMLRQAAGFRRTQAATMLDNAARYEKIAAALEEHGAVKVDDLPEPVLEALFGAVAA